MNQVPLDQSGGTPSIQLNAGLNQHLLPPHLQPLQI
jgi:hypothetical protein